MPNRLAVSTECPTCAAPLDFGEGSNAIRCGHCGANLLLTGRRRVLAYWIRPKVEPSLARQRADAAATRAGLGIHRLGEARLWFVPYYRLTGTELRSEIATPPIGSLASSLDAASSLGLGEAALAAIARAQEASAEPSLRDRHVEKNFLAADLGPGFPYSIGVRASVLHLELFRRTVVEALGACVPPAIGADEALAIGRRTVDEHRLVRHELLGVRLSLVYFPYWTVDVERPGKRDECLVDGVSGAARPPGERSGGLASRARPLTGETATVGFRPLLCPNCGWDLPLRPDDAVFCCEHCVRAWEIDGSDLKEVSVWVAESPSGVPTPSRATTPLPFWRLGWKLGRGNGTSHVPAFRFRRLKSLVALAASYGARPPALERSIEPPKNLGGVYYDRFDARILDRFARPGESAEDVGSEDALVWIPYRTDGYSLVDPFFGTGLSRRLLA